MSTFFELAVKVSFVGRREWRARCGPYRATCTWSGEEAARKAVALALDASGKLNLKADPARIVIVKRADGSLVGRLDLESEVAA